MILSARWCGVGALWHLQMSFLVAQVGMVVANNGISTGVDLSALMPFIIHHGMLLMLGLVFYVFALKTRQWRKQVPNRSGRVFVFLGPMTGVMFADYFILRKRCWILAAARES